MLVPVAVCPCPNTQALHPCSDIITSPTSEVRRAAHSGGCSSHVSAWLPEPCVSCLCSSCVVHVWLHSCQCVHVPGRKAGYSWREHLNEHLAPDSASLELLYTFPHQLYMVGCCQCQSSGAGAEMWRGGDVHGLRPLASGPRFNPAGFNSSLFPDPAMIHVL